MADPNIPNYEKSEGGNPLQMYLRDIANIPLLTKAEETELHRLMKANDPTAREKLIRANLRLVIKIAYEYDNLGLPLMDLISEGNIGLMRAIDRFDPRLAKLSTYASFWIKQAIKRGLGTQARIIRLPIHALDTLLKIRRLENTMHDKLQREPTSEEIAIELKIPVKKVRLLREAGVAPVSIDAPLTEDTDGFSEILPDEHNLEPDKALEAKGLTQVVQELLNGLDPRERMILSYRYGLNGGRERTLDEVGNRFKVSRERIRQIQNKVVVRLNRQLKLMNSSNHQYVGKFKKRKK